MISNDANAKHCTFANRNGRKLPAVEISKAIAKNNENADKKS